VDSQANETQEEIPEEENVEPQSNETQEEVQEENVEPQSNETQEEIQELENLELNITLE